MSKQRLIFIGLFLFLIWFFFDVFFSDEEKSQHLAKEYMVSLKDISSGVYGSGQIYASQEILIKSLGDAMLQQVSCSEGDKVKKNDLLIVLENDMLAQEQDIAHAKYLQAEEVYEQLKQGPSETDKLKAANTKNKVYLQYQEAKKKYEDQQELFTRGFVSKKSLESSKQSYTIAENEWKVAEETFKESTDSTKQHDISLAKAEASKAKTEYENLLEKKDALTLKAPFSGTVIELMVASPKDDSDAQILIKENQPLLSLADMSKMLVKGSVFESDVNKLKNGQQVVLMPPGASKHIPGVLSFVSQKAKNISSINRFEVRIDIEGAHEFLKYGMNTDFKVIVDSRKQVIAVPLEFIMHDSKGDYVMLKKKNKVNKVYIEAGIDDKLYAEIRSGLRVGDKICYRVETYN